VRLDRLSFHNREETRTRRKARLDPEGTIGMTNATYTVVGMTCSHCVNAVTEEVSAIPDVTDVDVSLVDGRLTVTSTNAVSTDAVRAAVEEAGYELVVP